eukprot:498828-Hanusia_phi.AAC.1
MPLPPSLTHSLPQCRTLPPPASDSLPGSPSLPESDLNARPSPTGLPGRSLTHSGWHSLNAAPSLPPCRSASPLRHWHL